MTEQLPFSSIWISSSTEQHKNCSCLFIQDNSFQRLTSHHINKCKSLQGGLKKKKKWHFWFWWRTITLMTVAKEKVSSKHIMVLVQPGSKQSSKMMAVTTQRKHQRAKPSRAVHVNCSSPLESPVSFLLSLCVTVLLPTLSLSPSSSLSLSDLLRLRNLAIKRNAGISDFDACKKEPLCLCLVSWWITGGTNQDLWPTFLEFVSSSS